MRVLPGPTKSNQALVWSPDCRLLAAGGSGDGVMVWDVNSGETGARVLSRGHGGRFMQFCPRTGLLFVAFQSNGFWSWNPETSEESQRDTIRETAFSRVLAFAIASTKNLAVLQVHEWSRGNQRCEARGYAISENGRLTLLWTRAERSWQFANSLVFRGHTTELFVVGRNEQNEPRVRWVDAESGELVSELELAYPRDTIRHWALSPHGDRVAWITDRALYACSLDNSSVLELPNPGGVLRRGLAWSPDGRILSYAEGTAINLLDANTFTEIRALDWGIGKPRAVAFAPDGLRCAVSGDSGRGWVTVFDLDIE